jgi:hypothetical protein
MGGCSLYTGDTASGKTHLAYCRSIADVTESGQPLLILDSFGADNFDSIRSHYECESLASTVEKLYGKGEHVIWSPRDCDELEEFSKICWKAAKADPKTPITILLDESSPWLSPKYEPPELTRLIRGHRHCGITLHITTQYCGDLPPVYWQCCHHIYIFRNTSPRALERIKLMLPSVDPEKVRTMPLREHIAVET